MKAYTKELGIVKITSIENGAIEEVEKDGIRIRVADLPEKTITILTFLQYILQGIINFVKSWK